MSPLPSRSPPFPYTTLFRSHHSAVGNVIGTDAAGVSDVERARVIDLRLRRQDFGVGAAFDRPPRRARVIAAEQVLRSGVRPEEHTSELQSRLHLVCRLLLEK